MKGFEEILSQLIAEGKSLETEIQKNAKRKEEDQQKTISLNVKSMTEVLPIHRTTIGLFLIDFQCRGRETWTPDLMIMKIGVFTGNQGLRKVLNHI